MKEEKERKRSKLIFRIGIAVVMVMTFAVATPVMAQLTTISIGSGNAIYCNITTIPIMLNITDPAGLGAATINLTYDPNVCIAMDVVKGFSSFDVLTSSHPYTNTSGYVKIVAYQTGAAGVGPGLVNFANITFHAKGAPESISYLKVNVETLKNNKGISLSYTVVNGTFLISKSGTSVSPGPEKEGEAQTTQLYNKMWVGIILAVVIIIIVAAIYLKKGKGKEGGK